MTSAIESPVRANAGVGFAIPSAIVNNVVPALINDGKYVHSWLGIGGTTLTPDLAKAINLDLGQRGALVEEVMPNSPAQKGGLQASNNQITIDGQNANVGGDVITAIDNQPVLAMDDLIAYLAGSTKVDQKVTLTILRDGKQQNVDVTLAARPSAEQQANANPQAPVQGIHLGNPGLDRRSIHCPGDEPPGWNTGRIGRTGSTRQLSGHSRLTSRFESRNDQWTRRPDRW